MTNEQGRLVARGALSRTREQDVNMATIRDKRAGAAGS